VRGRGGKLRVRIDTGTVGGDAKTRVRTLAIVAKVGGGFSFWAWFWDRTPSLARHLHAWGVACPDRAGELNPPWNPGFWPGPYQAWICDVPRGV